MLTKIGRYFVRHTKVIKINAEKQLINNQNKKTEED